MEKKNLNKLINEVYKELDIINYMNRDLFDKFANNKNQVNNNKDVQVNVNNDIYFIFQYYHSSIGIKSYINNILLNFLVTNNYNIYYKKKIEFFNNMNLKIKIIFLEEEDRVSTNNSFLTKGSYNRDININNIQNLKDDLNHTNISLLRKCLKNKLNISKELFNTLILKFNNNKNEFNLIDNDIERTKNYYRKSNPNLINGTINNLNNLLVIFHIYRNDIGYIQGLSQIGIFIIKLNKDKTNSINDLYEEFVLFSNIIIRLKPINKFYLFDKIYIDKFINFIKKFLKKNNKIFINKIDNIFEMLIIDWVFTIFTKIFPLNLI